MLQCSLDGIYSEIEIGNRDFLEWRDMTDLCTTVDIACAVTIVSQV